MYEGCTKCNEKDLSKFYLRSDGRPRNLCKVCYKNRSKIYDAKEENKKNKKKYREEVWTKEKHAAYCAKRYETHKEYSKEYYLENREAIIDRVTTHLNKPGVRQNNNKRISERRATDEVFNLKCRIRTALRKSLRGLTKTSKTFDLLGYTKDDLYSHLAKDITKFKEQNIIYHLDHKIPIDWFELEAPQHIINALDNLQILCAKDNLNKNMNFAHPVCESFAIIAIQYIKEEYKDQIIIK